MRIFQHTPRLLFGIVLGLATVLAAACAAATAARPAGMSPAEYRALMLRSQALNELYAPSPAPATLRADRLRGEELNRLYGNYVTRMTPAAFRAEYIRGSWLNEHARTVWPVSAPAPAVPHVVTVGDGFDWGDAAIGAAFVTGVVLLGAGGAVVVRRHGHPAHLPH